MKTDCLETLTLINIALQRRLALQQKLRRPMAATRNAERFLPNGLVGEVPTEGTLLDHGTAL